MWRSGLEGLSRLVPRQHLWRRHIARLGRCARISMVWWGKMKSPDEVGAFLRAERLEGDVGARDVGAGMPIAMRMSAVAK